MKKTISRITIADYKTVITILNTAKQWMQSNHILQWNKSYPNNSIILDDIRKGNLYGCKIGKKIVSFAVLSVDPFTGSESVADGLSVCYLKRVTTHPQYLGNGCADLLIHYIEEEVRRRGGTRLVSVTNHTNVSMQKVFAKNGFQKTKELIMPKREEYGEFYLYEKMLRRIKR